MSDGPYRESTLVPGTTTRPIYLSGEVTAPTVRLNAVDYDDGSTVVTLYRKTTERNARPELVEMRVARGAVAWRGDTTAQSGALFPDEISSFEAGNSGELKIILKNGKVTTSFQPPPFMLFPDWYLEAHELAWLAGRLNRALARVKR